MQIAKQKRGQSWIDESGTTIPFKMVKNVERVNEDVTFNVAKKALSVSESLVALKQYIKSEVAKAVEAFHAEYNGSRTQFKGNYTIDNFDGSIRVEVNVNSPIRFDDLLIKEAKTELDAFLNEELDSKNAAIKQMVMDAFSTTRGKMDVKKILSLQRYADRVNHPKYTKAMELIGKAQRRPSTVTYYKVSVKNKDGKFESIPLNLADV